MRVVRSLFWTRFGLCEHHRGTTILPLGNGWWREGLDKRHHFHEMLALLNEKNKNGYQDVGEFLACHVKKSNIPGFWNCLHPERGIKLLIDIIPIAGARCVMINNLVKRTDLNNKTGVVLALMNGRFAVRVIASDGVLNTLVQASNLVVLD